MASYIGRNSSMIRKYVSRSGLYCRFKPLNHFHIPIRRLRLTAVVDKIVPFNLSDIGEGIREVVIKEWFVKVGDTVEQFDNLCEVQSDKASVTITSRFDGTITKLYYKVDDIALVGKPLMEFDVEDEEEDGSEKSTSSDSSSDSEDIAQKPDTSKDVIERAKLKVIATPAVRRIAMENAVDLTKVPATGKQGRVLKGDVLEFLGQIPVGSNKSTASNQQQSNVNGPQTQRIEVLKGVRKAMFKSMSESLKIPHFVYCDEVDMTNLIEFRNQLKDVVTDTGIGKLTFLPFCIKAASLALTKYPILNSSVDITNESVIYKSSHNISIAMDTPQGLVVPNLKNCQNKSIVEIAKDLNTLVHKGRSGSLEPKDFADGTFSLSNIGIIGGTYTHPCIMPPQVSIGAIGRTKVLPRFGPNGEIVRAHILSVSWAADHRVIDGVTMASFSNLWKNYLENPALFVMDTK